MWFNPLEQDMSKISGQCDLTLYCCKGLLQIPPACRDRAVFPSCDRTGHCTAGCPNHAAHLFPKKNGAMAFQAAQSGTSAVQTHERHQSWIAVT